LSVVEMEGSEIAVWNAVMSLSSATICPLKLAILPAANVPSLFFVILASWFAAHCATLAFFA
jgi:hypothetical protein